MFDKDFLYSLLNARHVTVLTGAGISAESGIPTFRDALTGLWANYDPEQLACLEGFRANPALVWGWYEWRRAQVLKAKPNAGHLAIADLAEYVEKLTVITQNVDDLHERAGSKSVIHVHGSLSKPRCIRCDEAYPLEGLPEVTDPDEIQPPVCVCGGQIRPGVVWFGEPMPKEQWQQAEAAAIDCDVMLVIGTSALVRPASNLPHMAKIRGAKIVQVNPDATPLDENVDFNFNGKAGDILPGLIAGLEMAA
jgi:NAD-dependent deacetylase